MRTLHSALTFLIVATLFGCDATEDPAAVRVAESQQLPSTHETPRRAPNRQAYFGDLHVHTSWSTDAWSGGNRVGPTDAYRFARGEAVELPNGVVTQLHAPLDFVALTDHAEGFDAVDACTQVGHVQYDIPFCQNMRNPAPRQADYLRQAFARGTARPAKRNSALCADNEQCLANARSTWQRVQQVANQFDDPGTFTALIGYEFSSLLPEFGMLHRNVIFRGTQVIAHAISSADVAGQADFFAQLDAGCEEPCQVLTIPHNTNFSWGLTFSRTDEDGTPYSLEDLQRRARLDRLVEVTQQKGTSECQIGVGAADEDCDFGILFKPCEESQTGQCSSPQTMVRNALLDGIVQAYEDGLNPFKLGMIGSTDTHNSDPGYTNPQAPSSQAQVMGDPKLVAAALASSHIVAGPTRLRQPGGLAGVWAEANTRADLWDAMHRREAFATSGGRMRIRFFAGDLPIGLAGHADPVAEAYANGVPMGADLHSVDPSFWVWAAQDPAGPKLDRIQVVKGWMENGTPQHSVRDVVCSGDRTADANGRCPPTPATEDLATCVLNDTAGANELQVQFKDPEFVNDQHAFYYVRVFENPTCRWTTWVANSAGVTPPADVSAAEQQRGWSSPIWVQP